MFEFRIHSTPEVIPIEQALSLSANVIANSRKENPLTELEREVADLTPELPTPLVWSLVEVEAVRVQLMQSSPYDFEHFIKKIMERSGFVEVSVTKLSGDGGIDVNGYVEEANEFFAGTHVQAQVKRWRHAIGSPEINSFRGALSSTAKGIFITTSHFTRAAVAEARHAAKPSISLIDGDKLVGLVKRSGLAVHRDTE